MADGIDYEWCAEETDAHGDVVEVHFFDTRTEAQAATPSSEGCTMRVVLVRSVVRDGGLWDRTWAYLDAQGHLPERFSTGGDLAFQKPPSGAFVPQRFLRGRA